MIKKILTLSLLTLTLYAQEVHFKGTVKIDSLITTILVSDTTSDALKKSDSTLYATQTDIASLASKAELGDSVDLRIPKDITTLTEQSTPISNDLVVTYDLEADGVRKTALADLPASNSVVTLLESKVSTATFDDTVAYFISEIQRLEQLIGIIVRPDTIETPFSVTSLASTQVPSHTTSSITLTWTDPNAGSLYKYIYRSTDGVNFSLLDSVTANTYVNSSISPRYNNPYYYYVRVSNGAGTLSNQDTALTNQVSNFITKNWYTTNVDSGDGTALATPEHFAKFIYSSLGSVHPGDTVFISGGASSMVYDNSVALYPGGSSRIGGFFINNVDGTSDNRIVFTRNTASGRNGTPIFRYNANSARQIMLVENSSYLEFSYLNFDSSYTSRHQLYLYYNNTDIDVKYNDFYHLMHSGIANESPNVRILYNDFYSDTNNIYTADAIWFNNTGTSYNAEIGYNNIYQRNMNTASIQHTDGMQLNNIKGTTLIHDNFIVRYVGLDGYLSTGLYVDNGAEGNLYVWNNIFVTTGGSAKFNCLSIRNEESANPLYLYVYNNTFYGGSMDLAANSLGTSVLTFKNNLFYKIPGYNNAGFNIGTDAGSYEFGSYDMDYNRYYINTTYPFVTKTAYTWANWLTYSGGESHSGTNTTSFTVVDNTDNTSAGWKLTSGSEGIEDGVDLSAVYPFTVYGTNDFFGTARTGAWNIGAYEGAGE